VEKAAQLLFGALRDKFIDQIGNETMTLTCVVMNKEEIKEQANPTKLAIALER